MWARSQTSGDWSGENWRASCSSPSGASIASVFSRACARASARSERDAELSKTVEDQRRDHPALPHGGGDALRRAVPHVARREEPDAAGLEGERIAIKRPALLAGAGGEHVPAGEDVAGRVGEHVLAGAPVGVRRAADAQEDAVDL